MSFTELSHGEITNPSWTLLKQCVTVVACARSDKQFWYVYVTKNCCNKSTLVFLDVHEAATKKKCQSSADLILPGVADVGPTLNQHCLSVWCGP